MSYREDCFDRGYSGRAFTTLEMLDRYRKLCLGLPIPNLDKGVPWGYIQKEDDPHTFYPDDRALRLLYKVKSLLKDYSYEDMATWLTDAGYPTTRSGLQKIMKTRLPFKEIELPLEERMKL